ncbi:hypothetical protein ACQ4PT_015161 [Festuca glaucescens]
MAAPAPPPPSLDYWRGFFNGARASIFDTIDAAIRVAAADCPDALRARRDAIAHPPLHRPPPAVRGACARDGGGRRAAAHAPRGVPVASPASAALMAPAVPHRRDGQDPVAAEVFLVKAALSSDQQMSEDELLEHLQRLQQLKLTVDTIKATEIGKAVKHLRKHSSKQIRQLVRSLIEGWQTIVTEWMSNEAAIVDHTPQSMDSSCLEQEEGGLPSPPMDEAALFATLCGSIELSETLKLMPRRANNNVRQTKSLSRRSFLSASSMIQCRTGGLISLR